MNFVIAWSCQLNIDVSWNQILIKPYLLTSVKLFKLELQKEIWSIFNQSISLIVTHQFIEEKKVVLNRV